MRTNFKQRASEKLPELLPEYELSVGPIYKMMAAEYGNSASDPRKIADIVVKLSNMEGVPKRLILGKDAETYVKQDEAARAKEAAKHRDLTLSKDFRGEPALWCSAFLPQRHRRRRRGRIDGAVAGGCGTHHVKPP